MTGNLPGYDINPATWFYLSLLLIMSIYFRFGRVWSLRNLDLFLLLLMSPGVLLVKYSPPLGYVWLFIISGILLVRLFIDSVFQRRPRLEQNMNMPGMAFLCISTFSFLTATAINQAPSEKTLEIVQQGEALSDREETPLDPHAGPTTSILAAPAIAISKAVSDKNGGDETERLVLQQLAARILAVVLNLSVVLGLIFVGRLHFDDMKLGLSMGTLYLFLPCTSYDVGEISHVLPSAFIVWAFVAFKKPMIAGGLMGFSCGALFFPVFLLPLWAAFYDRRGAIRFCSALGLVGIVMAVIIANTSDSLKSFLSKSIYSFQWLVTELKNHSDQGFWSASNDVYRFPVFVAFIIMVICLTIWPRKKNLEHLMAHSAAIVVGIQFWYPGVYLLWYLPLLLMVFFRPRLTHKVYQSDQAVQRKFQESDNSNKPHFVGTGTSGDSLHR
jgi:hypothetical protein